MPDLYLPVHPMIFRLDSTPQCSVYVLSADGSYSLFHEAGTQYAAETHGRIFNESIQSLYVRNDDFGLLQQYLEEQIGGIMVDPFIGEQDRAEIAHGLLTYLAETLFARPAPYLVKRYKRAIAVLTRYMLNEEDAIAHLIARTKSSFLDANHLVNVGIYAMGLARELIGRGSGEDMAEIAAGFFLHDIGRYDIPRRIIEKNGPLDDDEWEIVKRHPRAGCELIRSYGLESPETRVIILQHHERHDGRGYPEGLSGGEIHTYGKICAIADAFDALTSHRPYRTALSSFDALQVMHSEMKNEFDPDFFVSFVLLFSRDGKMTIDRSAPNRKQ